MRDYGKVSPRFWTGRTGRAIRAKGVEAQIVALYLMSAPGSSMTGLYYLPLPTLAHETGLPFEGASKGLRSLSEVGFAEYDADNEVVWVRQMGLHQIAETVSPKDLRHKAIVREAERYAYSPLFLRWHAHYRQAFNLPEAKVDGSPFEAPSKPLRSQEQEQEKEKEQEQEGGDARERPSPDPPAPKRKRAGPATTEDTAPLPGTLAAKVHAAIVADPVLRPITGNPGDFAMRVCAEGAYPGVDILAHVLRAGEHAAGKPAGSYSDGRAYLRRWLKTEAEREASRPKPAAPSGAASETSAPDGLDDWVAEEERKARLANPNPAARLGGVH